MPASDSNCPATSAAWALTSCTHKQSTCTLCSQVSNPLLVAERMPLRFRLVKVNTGVSKGEGDINLDKLASIVAWRHALPTALPARLGSTQIQM